MKYDEKREDLIRWALEWIDDRILSMLWYPAYQELSFPAFCAFMSDIKK
jgi:hypothetical protein